MSSSKTFSQAEWDTCIKVLQVLSRDPDAALDVMTLKGLVTKLSRDAKKRQRNEAATQDRQLISQTRLWQANAEANHPVLPMATSSVADQASNSVGRLHAPRACYVCKGPFSQVHHHYHMLCPPCAEINEARRSARVDLSGRTALITGGRIKIGWQLALRLLRDGARVIVTTRFPHDAALRFAKEMDCQDWRDRLVIHGLDFRNVTGLENFIRHLLETESALDILINNAAQTIRRSPAFYEHLRETELVPLPAHVPTWVSSGFGQLAAPASETLAAMPQDALPWLPAKMLDADGQQVDLTPTNSWTARAGDVSTAELLEVLLVSQSAPFLLASRLRPLMQRSSFSPRFVVNVSAMEGQFNRPSKTASHPHTNMAKAALNMFTRTSAQDFATDAIWMNSVDTGWVTDENPFPKKTRILSEQHFIPPLDAEDGMARVYDPIIRGTTQPDVPCWGNFFKDYQPYPW
ncbi:short chain dehydrogenase [Prosthecobacter debontii]|uniref:Short chain dehydrogenase n=1 Tax=Prosthecobacter debontii TaxID=48467 RepID=A0A1T4YMF2_9BACT|nr:SDR family oxidoreductase [Prosthecobacter debontii]SKB03017.1 short chain dehydrogenase [Prosthecobacter debontii]